MITPVSVILCALCCLITGATQMLVACLVTDNKPSWRIYGWFALTLTVGAVFQFVTGIRDTAFNMPLSCLIHILPLVFVFHLRGWRLLKSFFVYFALMMMGEFILGVSIMIIGQQSFADAMHNYGHPVCLLGQFILAAGCLFFAHLFGFLRRIRTNKESLLIAGRFLRILLTVCIVLILQSFVSLMYGGVIRSEYGSYVLLFLVSIALLFALAATYLVQDIKYIILYHQNHELLRQQEMQNALLHRSRMFHHNLANVLCGLQGTIYRRDFEAIDAYCLDIVKRCQMINNENVQALRQIPRPAVSLLIQQKILDANEAGVPFYVHIDDGLVWRGWRDADMCQLLGVLLDNACEAASCSDAPYISLEIHNLHHEMELVVRNTWGEKPENTSPTVDTAPARGVGLPSVQALQKRYPKTTFSLYTQGRYVVAHLIF